MRKILAGLAMLGSTALIVPALAQDNTYDNTTDDAMNDEDTGDAASNEAASVAGETDGGTVDDGTMDDDVPGELPETGGGWGARQ